MLDLNRRDTWHDPNTHARVPIAAMETYQIFDCIVYLFTWHETMFRTAHGLTNWPNLLVDSDVMCAWLINRPVFGGLIAECRRRHVKLPPQIAAALLRGLAQFGLLDVVTTNDIRPELLEEVEQGNDDHQAVLDEMQTRGDTGRNAEWHARLGVPERRIDL